MSELSDYRRCVSDPLEANLRERIRALHTENAELRARLEPTRAEGAADPGVEGLWCCHIIGPDDLYAAPDKETAHVWADQMNGFIQRRLAPELDVTSRAEAAVWPWSSDAHAESVERSVREITTPGVMRFLASRNEGAADVPALQALMAIETIDAGAYDDYQTVAADMRKIAAAAVAAARDPQP